MRTATILAFTLLAACGDRLQPSEAPVKTLNQTPILITKSEQIEGAIGKLVTIQGEFRFSKIQSILNVDVDGNSLGPDIPSAVATGILLKSVVTQEDLDREEKRLGGVFAHRGPGTYYHLSDPATGRIAKAEAIR
jgi:hypothetical protein